MTLYPASSPKQHTQRERAWKIRQLRGMWASTHLLHPSDWASVQKAIDRALVALGAESQTARRERELRELDELYKELT